MFQTGQNDEQRLAERIRNGENAAMREFVALYAGSLTAICGRYLADEEDVKDVLQESLIHIATRIQSFTWRGQGSLKAWAQRIVVNESLRFLRDERRHDFIQLARDLPDEAEEPDPPISDVPPDVLYDMVSQLPTGYRTVLNLYVFEDLSHQEIAQLLGIKENSSASQLSRAKSLLAKMIRQYQQKQCSR